MKTVVITGGTDGMGRTLALDRLGRGDRVLVVGRDPGKGAALLRAAERIGAGERAHFLRADLSLIAETRRVLAEITAITSTVDALVLGARHYRSTRQVTTEGFEHTFALFYLSRFLLSHELTGLLDRAERPVIVNLCGPGSGTGAIRWSDLGLARNYDGLAAQQQGGLLNDLLGIGFAQHRPAYRTRYVLVNPGTVRTSFSGEYDPATAAEIEAIRTTATPVERAVEPIRALLDHPPAEPVSAWNTAGAAPVRIPLSGQAFDTGQARRLYAETRALLPTPQYPAGGVPAGRLRALLDRPVFATVATIDPDGSPQQSVVWVHREDASVLFIVGAGSRKERNLRRDPRVNVLINPPDAPYGYAAIRGTATFEPALGERLREELTHKYLGKSHAEHVRDTPEADSAPGGIVAVRVVPERVTGRL